ncbi:MULTISPECIES: hypothetical protein [unclassified Acidovorax]|uniref:hypothetical protein n=1 Tax=unclassified Acidovorax TaxID=2684926 RepID=UPI0025B89A1E|nr:MULTISPECIES: hypothetical protein [unclassified Acidovorax]HQS21885.1 hypothetical protein [Acidovorax defluvii]HQS64067.1 hypothetical protein [Acidovorax defluvii]HQT18815.1 hypothetical protein [Acidovorax defluvii]HQT50786.1 hypothetical protein [Acidovorax defluvii]
MQVSISKLSVGLRDLLNTTPEHRPRYLRAVNLVETRTVRQLRASGAPLAREYNSWHNAQQREKVLHPSIAKFEDFIRVHGPMPDDGKWSLDRINPKGKYAPDNIRWASPLGQTRNRTNTLRLPYHGIERPLQTVADILGDSYHTVQKIFSRNPDELVKRLDSVSPSLQYQFPAPFAEELEAEYATDVRGLIKLQWVIDFTTEELRRLSEALEDDPRNHQLREEHDIVFRVMRHALAFRKWAALQTDARIKFWQDVHGSPDSGPFVHGELPEWERDSMQFQLSQPPIFDDFDN